MAARTVAQVIAYGMTFVVIPTPYGLGDNGVKPGQAMDCSRFTQLLMYYNGDPNFPRTTWTQDADSGYRRVGHFNYGGVNPSSIPAGAIIMINVVGEDNNTPPQHTGYCIGGGRYINAPHTGEDVQVAAIPNGPSEFVYSYLLPTYATTTPTTPTQPLPPIEVLMSNFPNAVGAALTADGNGAWVVDNAGNVYTAGNAPELGTLFTAGVKGVGNIVGIERSFPGGGYYIYGADGGVYCFGDAQIAHNPAGSYPGLPAADREGNRSFGSGAFRLGWGGSSYTLVALDGNRYTFTV